MSHAALILNITAPCTACGKPRGSRYFLKCRACMTQEAPVQEAEVEVILREYDNDTLSRV